ncbi:MAG: MmcQ/YjbR family DNA-binding protein, partial [Saprospiraceae bacterium]
ERAIELREAYSEIRAGWHMSKKHWNTVEFEGSLREELLIELIDHSYDLVVAKMKKADREFLKKMD